MQQTYYTVDPIYLLATLDNPLFMHFNVGGAGGNAGFPISTNCLCMEENYPKCRWCGWVGQGRDTKTFLMSLTFWIPIFNTSQKNGPSGGALKQKLSFFTIKVEIFVWEFLQKLHFIRNHWKLANEVPRTQEKMSLFFKYKGQSLPHHQRHLHLG